MKKALKSDLEMLKVILEDVIKGLPKTSEEDLIDLAAYLKPVAKNCETIDEYVKDVIKDKLKNEEGTRLGAVFKAVLKLVPVNRLNQDALKAGNPDVYDEYVEAKEGKRITYEVR